ncbi:GNAT family N-acetyltransferase [Streptomyces griseorubiginosus]|uniref:Amino-acid acetyltransferase n=1 Tax=Streptomyces griseorubiginosus TaxID=67304 RepID=A0A124HVE5_9ACTN|nr:GNAT family N-acetyltransferase [Streptomyces griseorubiginosus]AYC35884.1 Amino-acid acetyltransferase [Streptomyces griseorubiginosus]AYC44141.1 Amino-acid acetyltransferase [Streptomyces griseorubiginosus]KUN58185.1 GCN5 family acetyltransferase [Streptomyces griseorubiginosus]
MTRTIRDYTAADEASWLRCRVLSFLNTPYFDDVRQTKPEIPGLGFELVATDDSGAVLGVMDVTVDDDLATIDTVAVHPDHQHQGHGRALLAEAQARARALGLTTLDAWTRDLPDTLRWYRAMGFSESSHYLHVYANYYTEPGEPDRAIGSRRPGLKPMAAFLHASLDEEQQLRDEFTRIHVCRRFTQPL